MGGVVKSLGFGGGGGDAPSAGLGFRASGVDIWEPVNKQQAEKAYTDTQAALAQQQAFLDALKAQGGIQNQMDVYNQLQNITQGQGPNPAQAMLAQATGANVANQAALMAGQRGTGANAGLLARQAAMQGGALQQQAAGQGATMQAQQAMNALGQMGGIAGQQVANQAAATALLNQAQQSEQQNLLNMMAQQNQARIQRQASMNAANAGIAGVQAQGQQKLAGNLMGAAGTAIMGGSGGGGGAGGMGGMFGMAKGGEVPHYADGGDVALDSINMPTSQTGPQSIAGRFLFGAAPANQPSANIPIEMAAPIAPQQEKQGPSTAQMALKLAPMMFGAPPMASGGQVPKQPINGEMYANAGEMVPGKAKVKGDSYSNDTVDAKLSPGEIIIPRSIAQSDNAPQKAADFVAAVLAKKGKLPKKA